MTTKHLSLAAVASLLLSCAPQPRTIVVHNFADFDRQGELVEADIAATRCDFGKHTYILKDKEGREIPYQIVAEGGSPRTLLFQADVARPVGQRLHALRRHARPGRAEGGSPPRARTQGRFRLGKRPGRLPHVRPCTGQRIPQQRGGPVAEAHRQAGHGRDVPQRLATQAILPHRPRARAGLLRRGPHARGGRHRPPLPDRLWVGNHYDHQQVDVAGPCAACSPSPTTPCGWATHITGRP